MGFCDFFVFIFVIFFTVNVAALFYYFFLISFDNTKTTIFNYTGMQ